MTSQKMPFTIMVIGLIILLTIGITSNYRPYFFDLILSFLISLGFCLLFKGILYSHNPGIPIILGLLMASCLIVIFKGIEFRINPIYTLIGGELAGLTAILYPNQTDL